MKISPSILDANFQNLQQEINSIATADRIHLDIMDGHYVPNMSFGASILKKIQFPIPTEAHLMVNSPEKFFDMFENLGVETLSFHIENTGPEKALQLLKHLKNNLHINAGIVVDGYTEVSQLSDKILHQADQILIMSVKAGFGGQSFMTECLPKIETLRKRGYKKEIEIDGGIALDNVEILKNAGADIVVVGSFIMKKPRPERKDLIKSFQEI